MHALAKVISVDASKCLNCHACISACPVKYCNDGSREIVEVNNDMCIACGKCIPACTHEARNFIDDFQFFINDIIAGEKIIAISAPAVAASFPNQYLNMNGWLKEMGIDAVFDVSFGAELTVKSYIDFLNSENPKTVIAQPCPAIVTYIELYRPELIKYLAPVDSPVLHTIKMIKEFYPEYKDHKIAFISPCNAKKREIEETGLGDYNIGHVSVANFLKDNDVNLEDYPKIDFDNPSAERAVQFSSPGGLVETAKRWIPGIEELSGKIEGNPLIYEYLNTLPEMIEKGMAPLLIDCLNCEFGCNAGPLTVSKDKPKDEIEFWTKKRSIELKQKYLKDNKNNSKLSKQNIEEILAKHSKPGLYTRTYVNRWENVDLDYPTKSELKEIYARMHKYTKEDVKNCSSCGYNSCEGMATAINNNLNQPANCHYFLVSEERISHEKLAKSERKFVTILNTSIDGFIEVDKELNLQDANPAMKKILKKSDIIGRNLFDFLDKRNQIILRNQQKKRILGESSSYEITFTQSDGNQIHCLISASPKYSVGNQKLLGSYAMISDISNLKEAEYKLKNANENLEQKVKERTINLSTALEEIQTQNEEIKQQNEEILSINDALEAQNNLIKDQQKDINASIHYAQRIQEAALQTEENSYLKELFILFKPKEVVSGDFYLIKKIDNFSVIIAADCTGHGVPGAFMSLLSVSLLNEIITSQYANRAKNGFAPSKIIDSLRTNLIKTLSQNDKKIDSKDGLDIAICILNNSTGELQYSGAYNPLVIIKNNKLVEIKGDKMPVGLHSDKLDKKDFTNHTLQFGKEDILYIFSDGFIDQFGGEHGRKFMSKRFKKLLFKIHKEPIKKQKVILKEVLAKHMGTYAQTDDIVIIGAKRSET